MHIVDGILSYPILVAGAIASVIGTTIGLRKLDIDRMPQAAMMSTVFFIASLIHIPFGLTSLHFIGNGLIGLVLGWVAFPVLFVALILQTLFFGYGGLLVIGVNTVNMALPAVLVHYLFQKCLIKKVNLSLFMMGAIAGALAILLSILMVALTLSLSGDEFIFAAKITIVTQLPLILVESGLTGAAVMLLLKVKPDFFRLTPLTSPF